MVEKVAEADDTLMEKYLEDGVLEVDEIYTALRMHTLARKIFPVMGGDSRMADTKVLLDAICRYLPSPYQKVYTLHDPETGEQMCIRDRCKTWSQIDRFSICILDFPRIRTFELP